MSFERKFNTLLGKSDNSLYELSYDNGIELYMATIKIVNLSTKRSLFQEIIIFLMLFLYCR